MRYVLFFILLAPSFIHSQNSIKEGYCNCIKEYFESGSASLNINETLCFEEVHIKNSNKIIEQIKLRLEHKGIQDTLYTQANWHNLVSNWSSAFFQNNIDYFLANCDIPLNKINEGTIGELRELGRNITNNEMEYLTNKIDKLTLKTPFLLQRGKNYLALGKYDNALKDLNQCLLLDPENWEAIFLKALTFEMQGEYILASDCYQKLQTMLSSDYSSYFIILDAIARSMGNNPD